MISILTSTRLIASIISCCSGKEPVLLPKQGLNLVPRVSHCSPWGGKMRDPGNEVGMDLALLISTNRKSACKTNANQTSKTKTWCQHHEHQHMCDLYSNMMFASHHSQTALLCSFFLFLKKLFFRTQHIMPFHGNNVKQNGLAKIKRRGGKNSTCTNLMSHRQHVQGPLMIVVR